MSRREKLIQRLLSIPNDFSYDELKTLLSRFGYQEIGRGKTAGSRVAFNNQETRHILRLHKPHPSRFLKKYQLEFILKELQKMGVWP